MKFDWRWQHAVFGPGPITDETGNVWHVPLYHEFPKEMGGLLVLLGIRRAMFELRGPVPVRWIAPNIGPPESFLDPSPGPTRASILVIEFRPCEFNYRYDHGFVVQFGSTTDADSFAGRLDGIKLYNKMKEQDDPSYRW